MLRIDGDDKTSILDRVLLTFNICSKVVLPALSRPRKRSFACLLSSPREARRSKTRRQPHVSLIVSGTQSSQEINSSPSPYSHQSKIHMFCSRQE